MKFCKNCSDIECRCRHCKEHVYDVDCDIGWVSPAQLIMACRIYCKNCGYSDVDDLTPIASHSHSQTMCPGCGGPATLTYD